jgi:hypothetical protein
MTPEVRDRIQLARRRGAALLRILKDHLPREVRTSGAHTDWSVAGPAFIARSGRLLDATLRLPDEHEVAAGVLLRGLYEHIALFCWIAVDPANHASQWVRMDRVERLKTGNELRALGDVLDPQITERYETERDSTRPWPGLPEMAKAADLHWAAAGIAAFSARGLRSMYVVIYRQFSAFVHAMPASLDGVIGKGPAPDISRVGIEDEPSETNAFTIAPIVFGLGLLVSGKALGFPEPARIDGAFTSTA